MFNDKINIQEIVDLISARLSISKKQTEEFFRVLLPIIEETLMAGDPVKIKNFGTLKLQWNNPRKSVNVNTGEEIIIDGYNKVVFVPEESLKELVNEPFAHLFPIELDETQTDQIPEAGPLRVINEQALEIKNILSEISQLNNRKDENLLEENVHVENYEIEITDESNAEINIISETNESTDDDINSEEPEISDETGNLELLPIADIVETTNETQDSLTVNNAEEPEKQLYESQISEVENVAETPSDKSPDHIITLITSKQEPFENPKSRINIWWISTPTVIVAALVFLYFFNLDIYKFVNNKVKSFIPEQKVEHNLIILPEDSTKSTQVNTVKSPDDIFYENLLNKNRQYEEFYTIERLTGDRTIYSLAEKYYGHSTFWIYIYDANKKEIPDIWSIKRGTPLKIPVLDSMLVDTKNPRTFEIARNLLKSFTENQIPDEENKGVSFNKDTVHVVAKTASAKEPTVQINKELIAQQPAEIKKELPKQQKVGVKKETSKTEPVEVKKEIAKSQPVEVKKELPKQQPVEVKKETAKKQPLVVKKEIAKSQPAEVKKELPKQQPVAVKKETAKKQPLVVKKEIAKKQPSEIKKEIPKQQPVKIKKESTPAQTVILATETMREGSRLTIFARKYYGSKYFWVYIYEANRNIIKNPDNIPVGTVIKIPKLDSKIIDLNNPECITKAKELEKKYLKK